MSVVTIKKKAIIKYGTAFSMVVPSSISGISGRVSKNDGGDPIRMDSVFNVEFAYDTKVVKGAVLQDDAASSFLVVAFSAHRLKGEITHYSGQLYKCNAVAVIERKTLSAGAMGGVGTSSYLQLESDIPCFFVPAGYDSGVPEMGMLSEGKFKVYLNNSYDLKVGDCLNVDNVRYAVSYIDIVTFPGCFVCSVEEVR